MMRDFELAAKRHEDIQKVAVLGLLAKPMMAAGSWALKNPLKTLGLALTGSDIVSGGKRLAKTVRDTHTTPPSTFRVGPTF